MDSPAVSMLGDWGFVALFQHFRELETALSILPCLGNNNLSFQAMGSVCQPHQPVLPQEIATRNAELGNFGVL